MYFVGSRPQKVGNEIRYPREPIPEAADFSNLREALRTGRVICDYKDGETPFEYLPHIMKSSAVTEMVMRKALLSLDICPPADAKHEDLSVAYDLFVLGRPRAEVEKKNGTKARDCASWVKNNIVEAEEKTDSNDSELSPANMKALRNLPKLKGARQSA